SQVRIDARQSEGQARLRSEDAFQSASGDRQVGRPSVVQNAEDSILGEAVELEVALNENGATTVPRRRETEHHRGCFRDAPRVASEVRQREAAPTAQREESIGAKGQPRSCPETVCGV